MGIGLGLGIRLSDIRQAVGGAFSTLKWLLRLNDSLTADTGADATYSGSSVTYARTYDATSGVVLTEVPAGVPVFEGLRFSYNPDDDGVVLGSELVDELNTNISAWDKPYGANTVELDGGEVKITRVDNNFGYGAYFRVLNNGFTTNLTVGETYIFSGLARVNAGSAVSILESASGGQVEITDTTLTPFSLTFVATVATTNLFRMNGMGVGEIIWLSGLSLKQVTPAFVNTADDGTTPLHPTDADGVYTSIDDWANSTVYAAGSYCVDYASPFYRYYKTTLGGTSSGTGVADDSGVTDWALQGLYMGRFAGPSGSIPHALSESEATNHLLNSDSPATQTTASLSTGDYVCWMDGTGSVAITAGTATITGGGTATDGTPDTFTVTGAGTVTATVTGTPTRFQLEGGSIPTSFILTAGSTVTRAASSLASTQSITSDKIRMRVHPTGGSDTYLTDGTNSLTYDHATTTLSFTDGTNTVSATVTVNVADTVGIDFSTGKLYHNGSNIATNATVSPTFTTPLTISMATDIEEDSALDLTEVI